MRVQFARLHNMEHYAAHGYVRGSSYRDEAGALYWQVQYRAETIYTGSAAPGFAPTREAHDNFVLGEGALAIGNVTFRNTPDGLLIVVSDCFSTPISLDIMTVILALYRRWLKNETHSVTPPE